MTLYFAYGANMECGAMRHRCPSAQPLGVAVLCGRRFLINKGRYASVASAAGRKVHGVLWRLRPRDLAALNAFESLDSGLYRRVLLTVVFSGKRRRVLVYVGRCSRRGRPMPGYVERVAAAAQDWQLPPAYIREVRRWAPWGYRAARPAETGEIG